MAKIEVTINGTAYPCRPTMGAMLRFKKETGKEVTEITSNSLTDLCFCVRSRWRGFQNVADGVCRCA